MNTYKIYLRTGNLEPRFHAMIQAYDTKEANEIGKAYAKHQSERQGVKHTFVQAQVTITESIEKGKEKNIN